jgi:hypothetical protein
MSLCFSLHGCAQPPDRSATGAGSGYQGPSARYASIAACSIAAGCRWNGVVVFSVLSTQPTRTGGAPALRARLREGGGDALVPACPVCTWRSCSDCPVCVVWMLCDPVSLRLVCVCLHRMGICGACAAPEHRRRALWAPKRAHANSASTARARTAGSRTPLVAGHRPVWWAHHRLPEDRRSTRTVAGVLLARGGMPVLTATLRTA